MTFLLGLCLSFPFPVGGQTAAAVPHAPVRAAETNARYHRLICLVHLVGSGGKGDPIRPEYIPMVADTARQGIVAWGVQMTDDRSMAIIHVVAVNRQAFHAIFADKRTEIRVFEIGKDSRATIEAEMKKYKKGFTIVRAAVVAVVVQSPIRRPARTNW